MTSKTNDRRVIRTKNAIREAYIQLLMDKKAKKITITEIARLADIDRKTFYLHYSTVDDILWEIEEELVDELIKVLKKEQTPEMPFSITRLFEHLNDMVEKNYAFFQFIAASREHSYFFEQMKEVLVREIKDVAAPYFKMTETEFLVYTEFYLAGIISVYVRWFRDHLDLPVNQLADLVTNASYVGLKDLLSDLLIEK